MKKNQKFGRRFLAIAVLLALMLCLSACGEKTDAERFYEKKNSVETVVDTIASREAIRICQNTLEGEEQDIFLETEESHTILVHVLAQDSMYKVYKIRSEINEPLYSMLKDGNLGNQYGHEYDLFERLERIDQGYIKNGDTIVINE